MRSNANRVLAIAVVLLLQAGLCPTLCFAQNAEPASSPIEDARAPEKAPCHDSGDAPARGEAQEDCGTDCCRFDGVALVPSDTRAVLDAPQAAFAVTFVSPIPPVNSVRVSGFEVALAPPPRNLLLVKNSLLI